MQRMPQMLLMTSNVEQIGIRDDRYLTTRTHLRKITVSFHFCFLIFNKGSQYLSTLYQRVSMRIIKSLMFKSLYFNAKF